MLLIEEVFNESKKNIISELTVGDRFFTPSVKIESQK